MKVVTVVGARPQFIKAAIVTRTLRARAGVQEVLVHTGQHYDDNMSEVFFRELGIPAPSYNLAIGSAGHGAQTGRMLEALERVMLDERPDQVLVYGDTNSTLAAALAAAKLHIPVAHVEAGLRSFNKRMPEEINRILTDHASDVLFAPTEAAVANLQNEGFGDRVHLVGDVMYDAAIHYGAQVEPSRLERLGVEPGAYVLATVHRAENTDDPDRLTAIFTALASIADAVPVTLPLHPRTHKALERLGLLAQARERLHLTDPVGYLDMIALERNARLVVTDSGGVQKEAFFHRTPCVTLRDETEWVELVTAGWNRLVTPTAQHTVAASIEAALRAPTPAEPDAALYGGGASCERIADVLLGASEGSPA